MDISVIRLIGRFLIIAFASSFITAIASAEHTRATTRYVSLGGTDSGNCASSGNACATIAYAKSQSLAGDTILVGRSSIDLNGVFNQSATIDFPLTIEGRSISFFPSVSWDACSATTCPTITPPAGLNALVIAPDSAETVTVRNLNFADADDASAVLVNDGTAVFENCIFSDNDSPSGFGGAIRVGSGAVSVSNCHFERNSAERGGAIFAFDDDITVSDSQFLLNAAVKSGGGIFQEHGTLTITESLFQQNSAGSTGGGLNKAFEEATITHSDFLSNTANSEGGAILFTGATVEVEDSLMQANQAGASDLSTARGGAIAQVNNVFNLSSEF